MIPQTPNPPSMPHPAETLQNATVLTWLNTSSTGGTNEPQTPTYTSPPHVPSSKFSWTNSSVDAGSPERRRVTANSSAQSNSNSISPRSLAVRSDTFQSWSFGAVRVRVREEPVTPTPSGGAGEGRLLSAQQELLISPKTKIIGAGLEEQALKSYFDDASSDDEASPQRIRSMVTSATSAFKRATGSSPIAGAGIGQSPKFSRKLWKRTVTDLSIGEREREQPARKRCASASTVSSVETDYSAVLGALPSLTSSASTSVDSLASMWRDEECDVHTPIAPAPIADVDMDIDTIRTAVAPWLLHEEPWVDRAVGEGYSAQVAKGHHAQVSQGYSAQVSQGHPRQVTATHRRLVSDSNMPTPPPRPARRNRISLPPSTQRTVLPYDPKRRPRLTAVRSDTAATAPPSVLTEDSVVALERAIAAAKVACDDGHAQTATASAGQARRQMNACRRL